MPGCDPALGASAGADPTGMGNVVNAIFAGRVGGRSLDRVPGRPTTKPPRRPPYWRRPGGVRFSAGSATAGLYRDTAFRAAAKRSYRGNTESPGPVGISGQGQASCCSFTSDGLRLSAVMRVGGVNKLNDAVVRRLRPAGHRHGELGNNQGKQYFRKSRAVVVLSPEQTYVPPFPDSMHSHRGASKQAIITR